MQLPTPDLYFRCLVVVDACFNVVTKGIVEMHGGNISVHSNGEGTGSTFRVTLPVYRLMKPLPASKRKSAFGRPHNWARQSFAAFQRTLPAGSWSSMPAAGWDNSTDEQRAINTVVRNEVDAGNSEYIAGRFSMFSVSGSRRVSDVTQVTELNYHGSVVLTPSVKAGGCLAEEEEEEKVCSRSESQRRLPNILIVDDVPLTRKMMKRLLYNRSEWIEEAGNGAEAVELVRSSCARKTPYDVVIMDCQMPIMNGPEAAEAMRELGYGGIIIGVSGHVLPEDGEFFLMKGANKVMSKPIDIKELERIISGMRTCRKFQSSNIQYVFVLQMLAKPIYEYSSIYCRITKGRNQDILP